MKRQSILNPKLRYLQIALNGSIHDARAIIPTLPRSERILIEVGTPMIKRYGAEGIRKVRTWYERHLTGLPIEAETTPQNMDLREVIKQMRKMSEDRSRAATQQSTPTIGPKPYIVADMKMMDRGDEEVRIAEEGGAHAVVALGHAPIESLNQFITACKDLGLDSMVDMMNVPFPLAVLRELRIQPNVVILHRGVDETQLNKAKMLPLHEIRRIKGSYDTLIAVAGGDSIREVQSAMFNDADIVVVWKDFYSAGAQTASLANDFLKHIK